MKPQQQPQKNKVQCYKNDFSRQISQIFAPDNKDGSRILTYFERTARQLNIRNFDVREVLSEVTCRGFATIEKKEEPIKSVPAWFRSIGLNIIKDRVKAEIKARKLFEKQAHHTEASDSWLKLIVEEEGAAADEAFKLLSPEDQEILRLRFIEGMRYKEIQAHYLKVKNVSVRVPTLRKRESRAVDRLKKKFAKVCE
ncbi:MAG: sigma-70 family RNA polymerase sigma factor [Cyanobacteria bacterium J06634_5]